MRLTFRFIHAGALRLDVPVAGVGPLPDAIASELRDASLHAFDRLVELALAEMVDLVLVTGEIGAGPENGPRSAIHLRDGLQRLIEHGIQVVLATEDDDWLDRPLVPDWPHAATVLRPGQPAVDIASPGGTLATIGWCPDDPGPSSEPGPLRIGLLPSAIEGVPPNGFDYLARAGRLEYVVSDESPLAVSPGTLQGKGFSTDEVGAKGAVLVSVDDRGSIEHDFVPLDAVRFVSVELVVDDLGSPSAVARSLSSRLDALRSLHSGSSLIVEAALDSRGRQAIPGGWPATRDALLRLLQEATEDLQPFVWWDHVRLRHRLTPLWEGADRVDDFVGGVLELASELAADAGRRAVFAAGRSLRRELDRLNREGAIGLQLERSLGQVAGSAELIEEAAELAIDALAGEPRGRRDMPFDRRNRGERPR